MKVSAITCKKCGSTVFSRARHDMRYCTCKSIAIDGGMDYCKVLGNPENIEHTTIEVKATRSQLFEDWNHGIDKYGLIKKPK